MRRSSIGGRPRAVVGLALAFLICAGGADGTKGSASGWEQATETALARLQQYGQVAEAWYRRTPPADRITWGGLLACSVLGLGVMAERSLRLRRNRVLPRRFVDRFRDRLQEGQLDKGKGADLCEMNPSPASRVALAALRRWGRSTADMERAVQLARQVESDRLRRNVGTLRRIAALAPLLGLLGGLLSAGRSLSALGEGAVASSWGPAVANALGPLTAGVALAILALVAYDGLIGRVEKLTNDLDRLGAETIDAIGLATPPQATAVASSPAPAASASRPYHSPHLTPTGPIRSPHSIRVEIPDRMKEH
ncbi:hypothetical protein BH23PLA1_BH23PLA1_13170 [soil metagenome]